MRALPALAFLLGIAALVAGIDAWRDGDVLMAVGLHLGGFAMAIGGGLLAERA